MSNNGWAQPSSSGSDTSGLARAVPQASRCLCRNVLHALAHGARHNASRACPALCDLVELRANADHLRRSVSPDAPKRNQTDDGHRAVPAFGARTMHHALVRRLSGRRPRSVRCTRLARTSRVAAALERYCCVPSGRRPATSATAARPHVKGCGHDHRVEASLRPIPHCFNPGGGGKQGNTAKVASILWVDAALQEPPRATSWKVWCRIESCLWHRCSSNCELCGADSGRILAEPTQVFRPPDRPSRERPRSSPPTCAQAEASPLRDIPKQRARMGCGRRARLR